MKKIIKICFIIVIILSIILLSVKLFEYHTLQSRKKVFEGEVLSLENDISEISLEDVTQFDWDSVYIFNAYVGKNDIFKIIGHKWIINSKSVTDTDRQIVFVKNSKVVFYDFISSNSKYYIDTTFSDNDNYKVFYKTDNPKLIRKNGFEFMLTK